MGKIRLLSLFSGIGAFEKALKNIGINYELVNYCEIDKYASKSYSLIHNESESKNLWDITKVDIEKLPTDIDLITHGSPCQDFSVASLGKGGDNGTNTRSSLMWNSVQIIKHCKPKYVVWENVKNVLSKTHIHNFNEYLDVLETLGYKNSYRILNAKDFGIPQNRERIFVVSCLDEAFDLQRITCDDVDFSPIKYYLDDCVDEKYNLPETKEVILREKLKEIDLKKFKECYKIQRVVGLTDRESRPNSQRYAIYSPLGISPTLDTCGGGGLHVHILEENGNCRRLTPKEYFRLMGFKDADYKICKENGISDTQLYKQAGNSIVVNVLEEIFKNLLKNLKKQLHF